MHKDYLHGMHFHRLRVAGAALSILYLDTARAPICGQIGMAYYEYLDSHLARLSSLGGLAHSPCRYSNGNRNTRLFLQPLVPSVVIQNLKHIQPLASTNSNSFQFSFRC